MNNFNVCIIEGNVSSILVRKDGVVSFMITSKSEKIVDGVPMTNELHIKVVVTDRLADVCEKYLAHGHKVICSGNLISEDAW